MYVYSCEFLSILFFMYEHVFIYPIISYYKPSLWKNINTILLKYFRTYSIYFRPSFIRKVLSQMLGWTTNCPLLYYATRPLICLYRSEEHTSELQSRFDLVCRLMLETK